MPFRKIALDKAEDLIRHPEKLLTLLTQGLKKAYAKRVVLIKVWEDFLSLFRLVRAWVTNEYRVAPRKVILWAVFAIFYFINPFDIIPDIFPGGYLDDIYVIQKIISRFQAEISAFREWEKSRKSLPKPESN